MSKVSAAVRPTGIRLSAVRWDRILFLGFALGTWIAIGYLATHII